MNRKPTFAGVKASGDRGRASHYGEPYGGTVKKQRLNNESMGFLSKIARKFQMGLAHFFRTLLTRRGKSLDVRLT